MSNTAENSTVGQHFPPFRTIRYLGNKRKLLPQVTNAVEELGGDGPILDLFAGTNVVAGVLARRFRVMTNDLQRFSWIVAKALLGNADLTRTNSDAKRELELAYKRHLDKLETRFVGPLAKEKSFLEPSGSARKWRAYANFCDSYPHFPWDARSRNNGYSLDFLRPFTYDFIRTRRRFPTRSPHLLFSTYFSNAYFGIRQSLQIDSIHYAIDRLGPKAKGRYPYLAALIYAASASVSSPGHFAEFGKPHSTISCGRLFEERKKDLWILFTEFVQELFAERRQTSDRVMNFNADYRELLTRFSTRPSSERPAIVYADPPYFRDHYSRYYHVLETLVRYDYPESRCAGRYRTDRRASGFSMKSRVEEEFKTLAILTRGLDADLVLSYSDRATLGIPRLRALLKKVYPVVETNSTEYSHSTQGRDNGYQGDLSRKRTEYLFICKKRQT